MARRPAKLTTTTLQRLDLAPLPALARLNDGRWVVLAQCDARRVLLHDATAESSRPTIEPLDTFAAQWSGELILVASRASLAGELARFDFSWFVPALVNIAIADPAAPLETVIEAATMAGAHEFVNQLPEGYDMPRSGCTWRAARKRCATC